MCKIIFFVLCVNKHKYYVIIIWIYVYLLINVFVFSHFVQLFNFNFNMMINFSKCVVLISLKIPFKPVKPGGLKKENGTLIHHILKYAWTRVPFLGMPIVYLCNCSVRLWLFLYDCLTTLMVKSDALGLSPRSLYTPSISRQTWLVFFSS